MHRILKRTLVTLCVLLCTVALWSITAQAQDDSSLTVEYVYKEKPVKNATVEIYLVADWTTQGFTLTKDFKKLSVKFEETHSPADWRAEGKKVASYVTAKDVDPVAKGKTDKNGDLTFQGLTQGIYYVRVANMAYGAGKLISSPVLLTLPAFDNSDNSYIYHVTMEPKVDYEKPGIPEKPTPEKPDEPDDPEDPEKPDPPDDPDIPEIDIPDHPIPLEPADPDDELDIPDDTVPLAGTSVWMVVPFGIAGVGLVAFSLIGFRKKRK